MEIFDDLGCQIDTLFIDEIDGDIAVTVVRCKFDVGQVHERVDGSRCEVGDIAELVLDIGLTVVVQVNISKQSRLLLRIFVQQ